jgi:hypothetical protein
MRFASLMALFAIFLMVELSPSQSTRETPLFEVHQPTIVAFFAPVTEADLNDGNTNEALSDFQLYAGQVRQPLEKAGVDFHEVYTRAFRVRVSKRILTFPTRDKVGYYFVAPGKKPHIEYGVMTDGDILEATRKYFGQLTK